MLQRKMLAEKKKDYFIHGNERVERTFVLRIHKFFFTSTFKRTDLMNVYFQDPGR